MQKKVINEYEDILLVRVAWYYYMEGMTQQEIGEYLGLPRLRINRLLDKARKNGVIHFSLRDKDNSRMLVEMELTKRFHLKDVFIVPNASNDIDVNENVAQAAAMYINDRLEEDSFIGMGYGDTPGRVLNQLAKISEFPINIVSLAGGVNCYLPNLESDIFNAKLYLMPAPLIVQDASIIPGLEREPSVEQITDMISLAKMAVVGIGGMDDNATLYRNGLLSRNDYLLLNLRGAVGDILCHFIDENGKLVQSDIENRLISTSLDQLKKMDCAIAVAAGLHKAKVILAALRGGYFDILITDEATAEHILELSEESVTERAQA